jgi:hypothetical protein
MVSDWRSYWVGWLVLLGAGLAMRRISVPTDEIQFEEFASDELIGLGL